MTAEEPPGPCLTERHRRVPAPGKSASTLKPARRPAKPVSHQPSIGKQSRSASMNNGHRHGQHRPARRGPHVLKNVITLPGNPRKQAQDQAIARRTSCRTSTPSSKPCRKPASHHRRDLHRLQPHPPVRRRLDRSTCSNIRNRSQTRRQNGLEVMTSLKTSPRPRTSENSIPPPSNAAPRFGHLRHRRPRHTAWRENLIRCAASPTLARCQAWPNGTATGTAAWAWPTAWRHRNETSTDFAAPPWAS